MKLRITTPLEVVVWVGYVLIAVTAFLGLWQRRRPALTPSGSETGVLSHTVSGQAWQNLRFNGTLVGETGINAALCGHWGCPVLLVTGDRAVCDEGRALLGGGLTTVEVKVGLGRFSARQKTPQRARQLIEDGAKQALSDLSAVKPYDPGKPCEIEIEFTSPDRQTEYANRKGVEVKDARTLVVRGDDWWSALKAAGLQGLPLKMVFRSTAPGSKATAVEALRVEAKHLPDSTFEIPAGYREAKGPLDATTQ